MRPIPFLLIDDDVAYILSTYRFLNPTTKEGLVVLSATGLLTVALVVLVVLLKKKRRRRREHHHSHHHHSPPAEVAEASTEEDATASPEKRRRRRRSRRPHRPRNPTLAETGGLPPIRQEEPPAPEV
jgi:hypothetical protein